MGEEMEELCAEGLATHGDPESCVDDPRGRGEAFAGARAGRAIEPRNHRVRGADAVYESGRQHPPAALSRVAGGAGQHRRDAAMR